MSASMTDPTAGAGADPMAGAGAAAGAPDPTPDAGDDVIVTISKASDGSYMVYAGDEPSSSGDDDGTSADDADAMGAAGAVPAAGGGMAAGMGAGAAQGQPADSIGAALKIAMDILQADKSSEGAPGNSDDQLNAGFTADKSPTPATGPKSKY